MDKNYQQTLRTVLLRRGRKFAMLTAIWLGISSGMATAQVANYGFVEATATYTPVTGGAVYGNASSDDQRFFDPASPLGASATTGVGIPIGFNFPFNGETFDRLAINANGWISLGNSALTPSINIASSSSYNPLSSTSSITPTYLRNRIAAFARDLQSQTGGQIRVETIGASPNQVCVVQWENFKRYGSTGAGDTLNFQIRLYEAGTVEIHFGPSVWAGTATTAMVGLGGSVSTDFNSRTSTTSWTGTAASTANSNTMAISATINPPAGLVYRFTVPQPMVYDAAQVLSINNRSIGKGTVNNAMAVLNVTTLNSINPISVSDIQVNTGATALANISNVKVFYTGGSTSFSAANQFGTTIAAPTAFNTVTGSQTLLPGNNFFWITYDVAVNATTGDSLYAIIPAVNAGGLLRVLSDSTAALPRGIVAPISGTVSVGTGQAYTNFTSLFTAISTAGASGNIIANVTSDIVEPGAAGIGQWANVGGGNYSLTIRPSGAARKISGDVSNSGVLVFIGTDNVTIDGRIGGTGTARSLTIENTSTAGGVAILVAGSADTSIGGCDNFTLRNTKIMAGPTVGTTTATVGFQTQGTGLPSNNMLITDNEFTRAYRGILIGANTPTSKHLGLQITNNVIGSNDPNEYISLRGIAVQNAYGAVINNNLVQNMYFSLGASNTAIDIASGSDSCIVSNNKVLNISSTSTGGWGSYGINMSAGNNHFVYNNEIANVFTTNYSNTSTTFNAFGIRITTGSNIRVVNNTVHMSADYGSVGGSSSASAAFVMTSSQTGLQLINNVFSNQTRSNASGSYHFAYWFPSSYNFGTGIQSMDKNNAFVGNESYHYIGKTGTTAASNNFKTFADWQTLTSRDSNSISTDPIFFMAGSGFPNSPVMDNAGLPYPGITTDINGATRSTTTPDLGAIEYTPIATDLAALVITGPVIQGCPTATQSGQLLLRNNGLQPINFSTASLSVTLRMSGPASDTETVTINTGTLGVGDTLVVNFPNAFNMTAGGVYTFNASFSLTGDGFAANNSFPVYSVTSVAAAPAPFTQNFDSGTSTTALNNWTFDSGWSIASSHGQSGNGLYYNLWSASTSNPTFSMPKVGPVSATSNFNFSYRIVNYDSYPDSAMTLSMADSMVFEISTDCGLTFANLYKIDSMNHVVTTQWANVSIPMTAFTGQEVIIRFRGHRATGDFYFDLDNMGIASPSFPVSLIAPSNGTLVNVVGAGSTSINANWTSASADPVIYEWLLSDTSRNFAAPLATFLSNNNGADTVLTLNFYQIDALMASLGIQVGQTALASWTVRINNGGSITYAQDTFNITLNRNGLAPVQLLAAPVGGTGTSQVRGPNGTSAHANHRASMVTLASEFAAIGIDSGSIITSMGFLMTIPPSSDVRGRMRVWLQPTDSTRYTKGTSWVSILNGMVLVADDSVTISSSSTRWNVNFTNPIVYGGKSWNVAWEFNSAGPFAATAATYDCNTALSPGLASGNSATTPPATLALTAFRTSLHWGVERRANDLDVIAAWALGKNPRIYGAPEKIVARVRNNGFNTAAAAAVTLNVSGANTFTSAQNVTLATDSITTLEFPFTAANTGFNTINVSVGADDRNLNNSKSVLQQVTDSIYSYADTITSGLSSVGYNTGSGLLLTKYRVTGTRQVKAARIRIGNNPATVGNSVYAVVTNDTGAIIAQSAPATIVTADLDTWKIFTFTVAPNITDTSFLIGLAQPGNTTTGYFPVGYQSETPTRPGAYFGANLGGGGLGEVSGFRLMIEAHVGAVAIPDTLSAFSLLTPANNDSINVNGAGSTALNFTWQPSTRSTTGAVTYTWTLETTNANPVALITRSGLTSPNVSIDYSALADTLTARGIAAGNSFNGRWRVVASSGTLTRAANANFNIKLRRGQITSIEESAFSQAISLYPNPANGVTTLEINGQFNTELEVVVVNAMGQEMIRKQMQPAMGVLPLDLSALNQGMYFVRISNGQELAVKRLMIQR